MGSHGEAFIAHGETFVVLRRMGETMLIYFYECLHFKERIVCKDMNPMKIIKGNSGEGNNT